MQSSFSTVPLFVIDEKVWRNFTDGDFICDLELFPVPKYQISSFHCLSSHVKEFPIWNISFFADLADTYRIIPSASNAPSRESGIQEESTCLRNVMTRRKHSYCSGRGRIYSTKACPGVSVQQPGGIYLEEQTQPFHWVGRLRKMTISSEDYCSNIALTPKSYFLRPFCLNPWLNRVCLSYLFL